VGVVDIVDHSPRVARCCKETRGARLRRQVSKMGDTSAPQAAYLSGFTTAPQGLSSFFLPVRVPLSCFLPGQASLARAYAAAFFARDRPQPQGQSKTYDVRCQKLEAAVRVFEVKVQYSIVVVESWVSSSADQLSVGAFLNEGGLNDVRL